MNYGHFDDERREYVITDPRTPVKWINYVGTLAFGGFVDQTGGSLICKGTRRSIASSSICPNCRRRNSTARRSICASMKHP